MIKLTKSQSEITIALLRRPGWAKDIAIMGDAQAAINKLREMMDAGGEEVDLSTYQLEACKICLNDAVSNGLFGLADDLLDYLAQFGIKPPVRE